MYMLPGVHNKRVGRECRTVNSPVQILHKVEYINYHLWSVSIHTWHGWQSVLIVNNKVGDNSYMAVSGNIKNKLISYFLIWESKAKHSTWADSAIFSHQM